MKQIDGQWVLVFTCHPDEQTTERRRRSGDFCTWCNLEALGIDGFEILDPIPVLLEDGVLVRRNP